MSFNIALSGLKAAQKDLDVTANNISNVNTFGFKESRAEFADVFSSSIFSNSKTANGEGVLINDVAQQFTQGSLLFTSNALDMAISGGGFFGMTNDLLSRDMTYTRSGAFKLDSENYIVNSNGNYLQGFPVNDDGSVRSVSLSTTTPVQIPDTAGAPSQTANIDMEFNLNSSDLPLNPLQFDPADTDTYNFSTSTVIYDSLGNSRIASIYFVKTTDPTTVQGIADASAVNSGTDGFVGGLAAIPLAEQNNANSWVMFSSVTDELGNTLPVDLEDNTILSGGTGVAFESTSGQRGMLMQFDAAGSAVSSTFPVPVTERLGASTSPTSIAPAPVAPYLGAGAITNGADPDQLFSINMSNLSQFSSGYEVTALSQDGKTVGRLTGVTIGTDGLIEAKYSNGDSTPITKIMLARFANEQGMTQVGNTSWTESQASGQALAGEADSGTFGQIRSGTLEQSNTNLTTELVDLITAQRNYQANSRALEVNSTITQTILQIR
ncbi:flagellar hook protein FlgE [Psychrosphaera aquimarina]|uniref:Flagellar hook protein FlgE n=1 Tax=Psychrosphaera aquimarina TaxID=2044854 RepID=A0ABU3R417_9GAMM|nr:flagellar hook protein FlgE [Psychrosphaera aquimarina]MDU0114420.1 flagellar hook protein FlgE [Psychrosphaera aquimarina]